MGLLRLSKGVLMAKNQATVITKREEYEKETVTKGRTRTEAEMDADEARELAPVRFPDTINELVGSGIYIGSCSYPAWKDHRSGRKLEVSRFYPHRNVIIDFPRTESDLSAKASFFKEAGIVYVGVAPGESLSLEEFKKRLKEAKS